MIIDVQKWQDDDEKRRCELWHSYFLALRARDQEKAKTLRALAQAQEGKRKQMAKN